MRYGIISDIHGNLEAFQAVLGALSNDRIDRYLSIGDVIGYGADPKACIRLVKSLNPAMLIAGNHEWGVAGLLDLEYFSDTAKAAVISTKSILDGSEIEYLKSFKIFHEGDTWTLVHGTLNNPEKFYYMLDYGDAYHTMRLMKTPLCFVGHSHAAGIFYLSNEGIGFTKGPKINIDYSKKYVINAGSIGQPRDFDPRAAYVIYDDEAKTVEIRRVEYDIKTAQGKILKTGLPKDLAFRLAEGR